MNLEDHAGDVLRKARLMINLSPESAAKAAGLTAAELISLEETGKAARTPNWVSLAAQVGLHPGRLEMLANGWMPTQKDLTVWRELRPITTTADGITVNCYLVWDEVTREAALFDTGWDAKPIFDLIEANHLQLRHVFITHTHQDHLAALGTVREKFPKVRLHSSSKSAPADQRNRHNDFIHLGSLRLTNRDTPGHSEDGVTYIVGNWPDDAPNVVLVGDALFAGSMGKAVGPAAELAKQKIRDQIFTLPADALICPGHGPVTTVGEEQANNPFFG